MSLDVFVDTQVATLMMLATGAANADLEATAGEPVVVAAVGAPLEPSLIGQMKLPALLVYRPTGSVREESEFDLNGVSTFQVDYWAPLTPLDRIATRWPLLRKVWLSIAKAIQGGMHPEVSNGAQLLRAVGLRAEIGGHRVDFARGVTDGGVYPFFRATFLIYEQGADDVGVTDVADLPAFLSAYTQWLLPDATPTSPTVDHTIHLVGYAAQDLTPTTLTTQSGQPLIIQSGAQLLVQGV